MNLVRVNNLPTQAHKEGSQYDIANGARGQSYRTPSGELYERVTLPSGAVKIYRAIEEPSDDE